jgi:1,4-dihydroxy-2-naphthoate octaprenyltransferase
VLVDGLLTRRQTAAISLAAYLAGVLIGSVIALQRAPEVLWIGAGGLFCAYFYHADPMKLSYRGFGEVVVAVAYGPLICAGAFVVQRQRLDPFLLWLAIPLGILIAAFLWINEFPDWAADSRAGKRTLVVRLGRARASRVLCILVTAAYAALVVAPFVSRIPIAVWLGLAGLPFAFAACRTALRDPEATPALVPAQKNLLISFVSFAAGSGLGLLIR